MRSPESLELRLLGEAQSLFLLMSAHLNLSRLHLPERNSLVGTFPTQKTQLGALCEWNVCAWPKAQIKYHSADFGGVFVAQR